MPSSPPLRRISNKFLFLSTAVAMTMYILWRSVFTLPWEYGLPSLLVGLTLLGCEIVAGLEAVEQYLNMTRTEALKLPDLPESWYPEVDIFIMTHNEDVDLLFKTVNAATYLSYPDKNRVHVYICDDSDRPEMRELAYRLGVGYFGLSGNTKAKAGNFNNALFQTSSPLVATFDADMIPHHNFLMRTVPYFFLPRLKQEADGRWLPRSGEEIDPAFRMGFIQTPQSFYNPDLFQFNLHAEDRLPNEQDYFFREINVGRNRTNTPIFAGSNALISREALVEVGGMAVDTITEDFETGMRIQQAGYRTYAVKEVLAHGLAPHTIGSLLAQRERWSRGCVQSLKHVHPFRSKGFTLGAKLSLLATLVYWWTFFRRFVYVTVPILSAVFSLQVVVCELWQILLFWLPYYFLNNKTLTILSANTRTQHWSNLIDTIMFPYLIGPLIKETLGMKKKKFVVTNKKKDERTTSMTVLALPHIFLLAASVAALGICLSQSLEMRTVYNAIIIFWLIVNGKNLALAIFFMMGRRNYRQADRFKAQLAVEMEYQGRQYAGQTTDVSETGLAATLPFPAYLPDDEVFTVRLTGEQRDASGAPLYQAEMKAVVAHVDPQSQHGWRYSLKLVEMDEHNRRQYAQIVYDRPHSLPVAISETLTVLDDFRTNMEKRLKDERQRQAIRRLPRLSLGLALRSAAGQAVVIDDFNYKYVWLKALDLMRPSGAETLPADSALPFELSVEPGPGVRFLLHMAPGQKRSAKNGALYLLLNWRELLADDSFHELLSQWTHGRLEPMEPLPGLFPPPAEAPLSLEIH